MARRELPTYRLWHSTGSDGEALKSLLIITFSATKRHKPNLSPGDLVYCHVTVADRDLDVELSCVDPSTTRDWTHKDV